MIYLLKYLNIFVFLSLFSPFLSLYINRPISNLEDEEKNFIGPNNISTINLDQGETITFNFTYENNQSSNISIFSKNNKTFTVTSNIDKLNKESTTKLKEELESKDFVENPYLSISSNDKNTIEIINIVKDPYSFYYNIIEDDDKEITINNYNFVRFIHSDEYKINVDIKFNKEMNCKVFYGNVSLSSNDSYLIPKAFNFEGNKYIKNKTMQDENELSIEIKDLNPTQGIIAFIFSINTTESIEFEVTINKDIMNIFLIGSIAFALIFAVITFFLIRRKQNISKSADDDFYKVGAKEEEKEEEKEDD